MKRRTFLRAAARGGAIGGIVSVYFALVGMVERSSTLAIIGSKVTLNWILLLAPPAFAAYAAMRPKVVAGERIGVDLSIAVLGGLVAGLAAAVVVSVFIGVVNLIGPDTVRQVFRSVSTVLMGILSFHSNAWVGTAILSALIVSVSVVASLLHLVRPLLRKALVNGLAVIVLLGLLQRIVPAALDNIHISRDWLYSKRTLGLTPVGAMFIFAIAAGATLALRGRRIGDLLRPAPRPLDEKGHPLETRLDSRRTIQIVVWVALAALLLFLPYIVGSAVSQILGKVGVFLLLGLGLNIVVGYAGLLDLGYVAFFSVGAYFTAILTGGQRLTFTGYQPPAFGAHLSFYLAVPIVVIASSLIGVAIGAPVLRLRGDYLAIVTLGFGEIARVIFGSTWAQGLFGGSNGMGNITNAAIGPWEFQSNQQHLYYLVLAFCLFAIYLSWRLQDSRIGRAWNAMREDEQVADAMGISTTRYKLLAFAMGGAIGSMGGAIFAVSIGSLTIASFQIIVSITALAIIILGGMGSIPGVVVGALVLIGLPGVLSEFEDYQLLIYGGVLIAIMLLRPQGLIPNVRRMRELREDEREQDQWAKALKEHDPSVTPEEAPA